MLQRSVSTTLPSIRSQPVSQDDKPSPTSPVRSALEEFFRAYGGRTLLAVSGGVDSLALLTAAAELAPERVGVASLDHGLRPTSAGEVEAVRALAVSLGLPFHTVQLGLRPGPGMEARARAARYAALETLRAQGGYQWVATAHTRDDQAETLLMRLGRGVALRGAGGVRAHRGQLVRPLSSVGRADVEELVAAGAWSRCATLPTRTSRCCVRVFATTSCPRWCRRPARPSSKNLARLRRPCRRGRGAARRAGSSGAGAGPRAAAGWTPSPCAACLVLCNAGRWWPGWPRPVSGECAG